MRPFLFIDRSKKPGVLKTFGLPSFFSAHSSAGPAISVMIYLGFASTLSQVLLVREFLVSFYGNELSIGIIFTGWLIWIGSGSLLGNKVVERKKNPLFLFRFLIAISPLITIIQILAVKYARVFSNTKPGEFPSMAELFVISFTILSSGCILWGMLFTIGAKTISNRPKLLPMTVNKAFVLELSGSVAGGLLFSFLLGSTFSVFQIICLIIPVALCISYFLPYPDKIKFILLSPLGSVTLYFLLQAPVHLLEHKINSYQWSLVNPGLTFIRSADTKYQNLSLVRLDEQYTLYANGRPAYNIPGTYDAEILVHSTFIHYPGAKKVLVIGGGFNGVIGEILKYRVNRIDYLEIDPALISFAYPELDKHSLQTLADERVNLISGDGRDYLRRENHSYDFILLNAGEPTTASANRFYTIEFYNECYRALTEKGVIAFNIPSSTEYITNELKDLNVSIYRTFKQVFRNSQIIPGTHAVLLGSKGDVPFAVQPDSLIRRFREAGITTEYFSEYLYEDLMQPERIRYIMNILNSSKEYRLNTDSNPVTYYFDLMLWNRLLQGDNRIFPLIKRSGIFIAGGSLSGILIFLIMIFRRNKKTLRRLAPSIITACCGFTGMALNLLLILDFQSSFGSVYEMIGAMIAANMLGLAGGALITMTGGEKHKRLLSIPSITLIFFVFVLSFPFLLDFLSYANKMIFTFMATVANGCIAGILFSAVNRTYLEFSPKIGSMYAFDVIGASIGALITCSVLLPVLGIQEASLFLALIFIPSVIAALIARKN